MNWQEMQRDWSRVRSDVHTKWNKLTDSDLKAIGGKRDELINRLQERYSMNRKEAEKEAETFVKKLH